jgi:hypothetical protein
VSIYRDFPKIETKFVLDDIPEDIDYGTEVHLDIESTGLNFGTYHSSDEMDTINVVSIGYDPLPDGRFQKAIVCQFTDKRSKTVPTVLKKLLTNKKTITYIHHAAFDAPAIYFELGFVPSNIRCTKALSKILGRSNNRYADLVKGICGLELPKGLLSTSDWGMPFEKWTSEMKKYCVYDVVYGKWIHDYLYKLCDEKKRKRYVDLSNAWEPLVKALTLSSKKGILTI